MLNVCAWFGGRNMRQQRSAAGTRWPISDLIQEDPLSGIPAPIKINARENTRQEAFAERNRDLRDSAVSPGPAHPQHPCFPLLENFLDQPAACLLAFAAASFESAG